ADTFRGDEAALSGAIEALLNLDAGGTLVPHGIGGHARKLLSSAASRLLSSAEAREEAERNAQGWHRAVEAICTIAGVSCALGASEAVEAVRAALQSTEARAREAEGAWAWLTERPNLSLEHY